MKIPSLKCGDISWECSQFILLVHDSVLHFWTGVGLSFWPVHRATNATQVAALYFSLGETDAHALLAKADLQLRSLQMSVGRRLVNGDVIHDGGQSQDLLVDLFANSI